MKYLYYGFPVRVRPDTGRVWLNIQPRELPSPALSTLVPGSSALGTGVLHVKAFEQHRGRKGEGERGKGKRWNIHLSMSFAFLFTLNRAG